jgi:hypothetical protein
MDLPAEEGDGRRYAAGDREETPPVQQGLIEEKQSKANYDG